MEAPGGWLSGIADDARPCCHEPPTYTARHGWPTSQRRDVNGTRPLERGPDDAEESHEEDDE